MYSLGEGGGGECIFESNDVAGASYSDIEGSTNRVMPMNDRKTFVTDAI